MKYSLFCGAALASLASSTAIDLSKRDSPLTVELTPLSNSKVKAEVTNTGAQGYNLFYKGSFLDSDAPADKLIVSGSSARADFKGVMMRFQTTNLAEDSFLAIAPGQTIETEIDLAELYDVESSDTYAVQALGALQYAEVGTTELAGAVDFSSNTLSMDIDGSQAKAVSYAVETLEKRTRLTTSTCSSSQLSSIRSALSSCASLATAAANAAASGATAKFTEYFKTASRTTVAARFRAVASDCSSTTSGSTTSSCTDQYGYCTSGVLAYTIPSLNYIAYCSIFFSQLPALSGTCHAQDRATTVLHEETHAPAVYSPGTQDNGYGYAAATRLTAAQALLNADSYALYANAIYVGC